MGSEGARDADGAAGNASTGVSGLLGLFVAATTQVVLLGVADD